MIVAIDEERCNRCGVCLLVCPLDVIRVDGAGRFVIAYGQDCMACFACELDCRPGAIRVEPTRPPRPSLLAPPSRSPLGSPEEGAGSTLRVGHQHLPAVRAVHEQLVRQERAEGETTAVDG